MTQDFTRSYLPPGVYVEEDESLVVSTGGIPTTLIALVGPARGYMLYVEQVVLSDGGAVLTHTGVDIASVQVEVSATRQSLATTDFDLSVSGPGDATVATLSRDANGDVDDGTPVWVSYNYVPQDYYQPKYVTNFEDVKDFFGEPLNTATGFATDLAYNYVTSPLSLAAKVAFDNGANELVLCATKPPTGGTEAARSTSQRTQIKVAMDATSTYYSVNMIVPVTAGIAEADAPGVLTDVSSHVNTASTDDNLRFAIVGFDPSVATAPDDLLATSGVKNRRVQVAYAVPRSVLMYSSGASTNFPVGHCYLAAAYAGAMASLPIQQSLTKHSLSSFVGLGGAPLSNAVKNQYASQGIAVSEIDRLGRLVVRHSVTTDMTSINTREASVVRARDALVTLVRDGFSGASIIGQAIDDDLLYSVKSVVQGYLETALGSGVIVSYDGLAVRQRPTDQTVVEIKFSYKPAYPLNYVAVSFSIDTTTGTTIDTSAVAA